MDFCGFGQRQVIGNCKLGNEFSHSTKGKEVHE
jgi:hypothetical protein